MKTITLEVPDDLATRLAPLSDRLPDLLLLALSMFPDQSRTAAVSSRQNLVLDEIVTFLAGGPPPEQIITFKVSPEAQARLETLLDTHRETGLSQDEAVELNLYSQVNHILLLLKARARALLSASN